MKVVLETEQDVKCVNWLAIAEQIADHAKKKIADAFLSAGQQLKELKPGETRKFTIEIGTVEISREADSTGVVEAKIAWTPRNALWTRESR